MSFGVSDGRLRVREHLAERPLRQALAPGLAAPSSGWSPTCRASSAAPASCSARDEEPTLREWLATLGVSEAFVERVIVPQAAAVWSADPEQMWTFPARFLVEFFDNHGMLGLTRPPALAHRRRRLGALRRGADRAVRRPDPPRHPGARDRALRGPRRDHAGRRRAGGLRRGRDRRPRRPGAGACSPTRRAAEHEILGAFPYQANEAVLHTDAACCPRRRRAWASWNYHLTARARPPASGRRP